MSRHLQTLFLLAVLSFLFVIPTQAQVTTASMSGTVMFQDEPVYWCDRFGGSRTFWDKLWYDHKR